MRLFLSLAFFLCFVRVPSRRVFALSSGVFDRAYSEIRFMIESNILHKFTETEEFRKAANSLPSEAPTRRFFFIPC